MTCEYDNVGESAPLSAEILQQYCITALIKLKYTFYQRRGELSPSFFNKLLTDLLLERSR